MHRAVIVMAVAGLLGGCATPGLDPDGGLAGKPLDEFVDEMKQELAQVHWRVRGPGPACGTTAAREVDLRDASVVLTLARVAQAGAGADVKLVAVPLGAVALAPYGSLDATRSAQRTLVLKLEVAGPAQVHDVDTAPAATRPVAQALNAAIDGFMRSAAREPCVRMSALRLTLVLDVERKAEGGFRIVVPALRVAATAGTEAVNTLTLDWAHVASNGFL
jgi:hypothetical protein